uniref:Uncharacterized protein n=1 Tax=Anguilla anguilla TaxID=7936 RepID=A0A0E9P6N2_ANGAN
MMRIKEELGHRAQYAGRNFRHPQDQPRLPGSIFLLS